MSTQPDPVAFRHHFFQYYFPRQQQNANPPSSFILTAPASQIFQTVHFTFPAVDVTNSIVDFFQSEIAAFHCIFDCYIPSFDDFLVFLLIRRHMLPLLCHCIHSSTPHYAGHWCPIDYFRSSLLVCLLSFL